MSVNKAETNKKILVARACCILHSATNGRDKITNPQHKKAIIPNGGKVFYESSQLFFFGCIGTDQVRLTPRKVDRKQLNGVAYKLN